MNLIYYPNSFLDKQVKDFDIENPPVDPKELKKNMVQIMLDSKVLDYQQTKLNLTDKYLLWVIKKIMQLFVLIQKFYNIQKKL